VYLLIFLFSITCLIGGVKVIVLNVTDWASDQTVR